MLNNSGPLRIQETYTLLENIHTANGLYIPKYQYTSLDKANLSIQDTKQFLADITNQVEDTAKNLIKLFNDEITKALFNLEANDALDALIIHLRNENKARLTLALLCAQLAEFIDLSRLMHFVSKTPEDSNYFEYKFLFYSNRLHLKKFASLIQLKFRLFELNLIQLLETSLEQSPILEEIYLTLTKSYLPNVADAKYPAAISLRNYDTSAEQLKLIIKAKKIPALESAFEKYQSNKEVYYDAEADFDGALYIEAPPSVNPKILVSPDCPEIIAQTLVQAAKHTPVNIGETKPITENESNVVANNENSHKKFSLKLFWIWLKTLLCFMFKTEKQATSNLDSIISEPNHSEATTHRLPSQAHPKTKQVRSNSAPYTTWKNQDSTTSQLSNSTFEKYESNKEVYYDAEADFDGALYIENLPSVNPKILVSPDCPEIIAQTLVQAAKHTPVNIGETKPITENESNVVANNENNHKKFSLKLFWIWLKTLLCFMKKQGTSNLDSIISEPNHSEATTHRLPSQAHPKTKQVRSNSAPYTTWKNNQDSTTSQISNSEYRFFCSSSDQLPSKKLANSASRLSHL